MPRLKMAAGPQEHPPDGMHKDGRSKISGALSRQRDLLLLVAGLLISIVALWSLASRVELPAIWAAIEESDKRILFFALIMMMAAMVLRGWRIERWSGHKEVHWLPQATSANSLGYIALLLIPARLGEFVRMELLARAFSMGRSELLGVLTVERAVDLVLIAVIMAIGVLGGMQTLDPNSALQRVDTFRIVLFVAAILACAGLLYVLLHARLLQKAGAILPLFIRIRVEKFVGGLSAATRRVSGAPFAISILVWALEIAALYLVLAAFFIDVPLLRVLLLIGLMTLSFVIPAGPAGLGVWQWVFVFALPEVGANRAVAVSGVVQVLSLTGFILVGAAASVWVGISRRVVRHH